MKLSIVIPAHDEEGSIAETVESLVATLEREKIDHDVLVIDDSSRDRTAEIVAEIAGRKPQVRCVASHYRPGFGFAVRSGLESFEGDAVAIMMADGSDSPEDLVAYYRLLEEGYECAFGSRFVHGAEVIDYPRSKLIMNRIVNFGIRVLFRHGYNDTTNAFKAYRREVIEAVQPLLSHHFNLTVELPLKAVVRGYSYGIVPISWKNRKSGVSKLALNEMGSRYLFIILYVFLEHHLSRGDYRRESGAPQRRKRGIWRGGRPGARKGAPAKSGRDP
ncbi:MAG TPA: glycosyltransferase family 2 protein [Solirubrobacterales bacterium]